MLSSDNRVRNRLFAMLSTMEKSPLPTKEEESSSTIRTDQEQTKAENYADKIVEQSDEKDQEYPSKFKLTLIVIALSLAILCIGLDNTIISTAIPKITDQFRALEDVGWYASAYLLTNCAFQLTWGKLYTFYSIKYTFLAALSIFELGSVICGAAPNSMALIIGRAIAGVGSGGVSSGAFLMVAHSVPPRQRPIFIGLIGGMYGFSSIAGPLLGGAFTDSAAGWRMCFYINLPLGLVTAVFLLVSIGTPGGKKTHNVGILDQMKEMDLPGMGCVLTGVVCLVLALQWGGTKYEWSNGRIIALLILAFILLAAFACIQVFSGDRATVPIRVLGNRNIWGSAIFGGCVVACFFVMLYYVSFHLDDRVHQRLTSCLDSNMVSSHQGCHPYHVWRNEPSNGSQFRCLFIPGWNGNFLHRILHPLCLRSSSAHVNRHWSALNAQT